jgi:hypothetical protein
VVSEAQNLVADNDLQGLQKSVGNAFGLYVKTRPPASAESVARAKALGKEGIHPVLARSLPAANLVGLEAQVRRVLLFFFFFLVFFFFFLLSLLFHYFL